MASDSACDRIDRMNIGWFGPLYHGCYQFQETISSVHHWAQKMAKWPGNFLQRFCWWKNGVKSEGRHGWSIRWPWHGRVFVHFPNPFWSSTLVISILICKKIRTFGSCAKESGLDRGQTGQTSGHWRWAQCPLAVTMSIKKTTSLKHPSVEDWHIQHWRFTKAKNPRSSQDLWGRGQHCQHLHSSFSWSLWSRSLMRLQARSITQPKSATMACKCSRSSSIRSRLAGVSFVVQVAQLREENQCFGTCWVPSGKRLQFANLKMAIYSWFTH